MTTEQVLFYILGGGAVLSSAAMLLPPMGKNPIHSAISLIVSFFFLAGLYALLSAHLLTALQIIVYAGAVMVLFTFVIMLLNMGPDELQEPKITPVKVLAAMLCLFIFGKLITAITLASNGMQSVDLSQPGYEGFGGVREVGRMLYTSFMVPFELVSVLLLVAAVGAVVLAKKSLRYVERPEPSPAVFDREHAHKHMGTQVTGDSPGEHDAHGHAMDTTHSTAHGHH
jgi:NADH-quinone oxidoreductase subunit J